MIGRAASKSCSGASAARPAGWPGAGRWPLTGASAAIGSRIDGGGVAQRTRLVVVEGAAVVAALGGPRPRARVADPAPSVVVHALPCPPAGSLRSPRASQPSGRSTSACASRRRPPCPRAGPRSPNRPKKSRRSDSRPAVRLALERPADRLLGRHDRQRRHRRDPGRQRERRVDRRLGGHDAGDEPERVGLAGVDRAPGQDQLHRLGLADGPGQALRAAGARDDADLDLGLAELGVVAGHDHVAGHRQLAAATERVAADGRDERLADPPDAIPDVERAAGREALRRLVDELLDVGAGREGALARPGDDDAPAGRVGVEALEGRGEPLQERVVERVELGRPVERDERHVTSRLVLSRGAIRRSRGAGNVHAEDVRLLGARPRRRRGRLARRSPESSRASDPPGVVRHSIHGPGRAVGRRGGRSQRCDATGRTPSSPR